MTWARLGPHCIPPVSLQPVRCSPTTAMSPCSPAAGREAVVEKRIARREAARAREDSPEMLRVTGGGDVMGGDDSFAAAKARWGRCAQRVLAGAAVGGAHILPAACMTAVHRSRQAHGGPLVLRVDAPCGPGRLPALGVLKVLELVEPATAPPTHLNPTPAGRRRSTRGATSATWPSASSCPKS